MLLTLSPVTPFRTPSPFEHDVPYGQPQKEDVYSHPDLEFGHILIAKGDYTDNSVRFWPILWT